MSLKKSLAAMVLFIVLAVPSVSFAEGFGVYEWSPAGVAMGDNYMFGENDPSVLGYNPAAITKLDGSYFSIGTTWVNPANNTTFSGLGPLNTGKNTEWTNSYSPAILPSMFYATKAGENSWWGIAIYSRYGNQIEYDKSWPGRYDTTYSGIKGVTVQPTYAWKMTPKLSAAVGVDINYMGLVMEKTLQIGDVQMKLDGTSIRVGGIFSLMYDFNENTSAALLYRTKIKHTMDADTTFSNPGVKNGTASGTVTLPDSATFGLGHKFNGGKTRVEFDATWTNWATYDALVMAFDNVLGTVASPKDWKASWRLGVGIEHKLSDKWSVLGGYVWEESPVPDNTMDFTVPTGDRNRLSVGFKYRPNDRSEWAFAYTSIWAGDRLVYSHLPGAANGADYASGQIHDSRTQLLSLGYTIKLK